MSLFFEYGRAVATLPSIAAEVIARAGKLELQLLVILASDPTAAADYEAHADTLAATLGTTRASLDAALSFWIGAGVISREKQATPAAPDFKETVTVQKPTQSEPPVSVPRRTVTTELPRYTVDEADTILATKKGAKTLVDEAQKALGRVFTSHSEISMLLALSDGLGLSDEYLLILLAYCNQMGKQTMRYAEKLAVSLYDADITTADALSAHLRALEEAATVEGALKRLMGLSRSFTAKEKGYIADWTHQYGFGEDMLEKAYEFAAEATTNPTLGYMNSILKRWHEEGIRTPGDADRDRETHRAAAEKTAPQKRGKKPTPTAEAQSFNVDEFFEVAISRGYENITGKNK